jgi:hypothetical protein
LFSLKFNFAKFCENKFVRSTLKFKFFIFFRENTSIATSLNFFFKEGKDLRMWIGWEFFRKVGPKVWSKHSLRPFLVLSLFVTIVWHCSDRKNCSRKVFILGSGCTFVPEVFTLNEKHPWLSGDLNPDPLAQQSGALTTVLSGHPSLKYVKCCHQCFKKFKILTFEQSLIPTKTDFLLNHWISNIGNPNVQNFDVAFQRPTYAMTQHWFKISSIELWLFLTSPSIQSFGYIEVKSLYLNLIFPIQ